MIHYYLMLVWYMLTLIMTVSKATHKTIYDLIYQTKKLWTILYPSIFYWHHLASKRYNMIQMQQISNILMNYLSKLQLRVIHETKYIISCTICKDSGNSMAFNIIFLVKYIILLVIHYLRLRHYYQCLIIIMQCSIRDVSC